MNMRFEPARGLSGELRAPADKSISHRAALLGAMASEPVRIERYLHAADTTSTLEAVRALGALVEVHGDGSGRARHGLREAREPDGRSTSATPARCCACCRAGWPHRRDARFTLDGDESIRRRPVDRIVEPLRQMGAELRGARGALRRRCAFTARGCARSPTSCRSPAPRSSRACCWRRSPPTARRRSASPPRSRDHTERMLLRAGVAIHRNGRARDGRQRRRAAARQRDASPATRAPPRS